MPVEPDDAEKNILRRLRDWATEEPLRALGLLGLMAYMELLIPAQLFYRTLETTPAAAGLSGIDVLLQQSALVLAGYAMLGAIGAGGYFVLVYPFVVAAKTPASADRRRNHALLSVAPVAIGLLLLLAPLGYAASLGIDALSVAIGGGVLVILGLFMRRIVFRDAKAQRKVSRGDAIDRSGTAAIYGLAFGAVVLLLISIALAIPYANQIKKGNAPDDFLFPWQARHVRAVWKLKPRPLKLPPCEVLLYLGEDDGRVLLWDSDAERALRIASSDLELILPEAC